MASGCFASACQCRRNAGEVGVGEEGGRAWCVPSWPGWQPKKRGRPPWRDPGLGICAGGGTEELVRPPSPAEPWRPRGAPKPRFRRELALVGWWGPYPSHAWPNLPPAGRPQCTGRSHPPQRVPTGRGTVLVLPSAPATLPALSLLSWLTNTPLGLGCLGSFRLLLKSIFRLCLSGKFWFALFPGWRFVWRGGLRAPRGTVGREGARAAPGKAVVLWSHPVHC